MTHSPETLKLHMPTGVADFSLAGTPRRRLEKITAVVGLCVFSIACASAEPNVDATQSESEKSSSGDLDDEKSNEDKTPSESTDEGSETSTEDSEKTESEESSDEDPGTDDDESEQTPGSKFDLGGLPDWEPEEERGCEKIDFLFVIDNSGSMEDEQKNLIASFPGFMESIKDTLMARDFHIMAVDSDGAISKGTPDCQNLTDCTCMPDPECCAETCAWIFAETCNGVACTEIESTVCEARVGTGRLEDGMGTDCGVDGDLRYLLDSQPDLEGAFECIGSVGTLGDGNELVIQSMRNAVSPEFSEADGCNEGFMRDDAILVVTMITDEEENGTKSAGTPAQWYEALVAAKGGNEEAVVMIGLIGDLDTASPICTPLNNDTNTGAEASPRLREFIELFGDRGMAGSVCADDYEPYFTEAVSIIEGACEDFIPK